MRFLFVDHDRFPVRRVKRVIGPAKMLAGLQVAGPWELPDQLAVGSHLDDPVVRAIRD